MYAKILLLNTVIYSIYENVDSWGPVGHSTVVRLAQSQLTEKAVEWTRALTPWYYDGDLSPMASWADNILYPDTNPTGHPNWQWTRGLHFLNIPDWSCEYQAERDCVNDYCISGAITNYTKRLESVLDTVQEQEALYFLLHFVGDIHQPLHTGFTSDRGGNGVVGNFMNKSNTINLHSLWDSELISVRIQKDFNRNETLFYKYIYGLMINQTKHDDDDNIEQWIKENVYYVCTEIYRDEDNNTMNASSRFSLSEQYYQRNIPIIEQRLAHGGRRLATILNRLANDRPERSSSQANKLCGGTIALIAVLSVEVLLASIIGIFVYFKYKKRFIIKK